ncbi:MAG: class I SAM-dependent methyltransferase [Spirochaetales bacterium]
MDSGSSTEEQANIWNSTQIVDSFRRKEPARGLMQFASQNLTAGSTVVDIGCGAGRHTVPLAMLGYTVTGVDTATAMLDAARDYAERERVSSRCSLLEGSMDNLPVAANAYDLVVSHGVWNLARSEEEFRRAVREAARVARGGAALYLTTFSRNTLPPHARPVSGTRYVFTDFNDEPQCFLTAEELCEELASCGFHRDDDSPPAELNRPAWWERGTAAAAGNLPLSRPKRPVLYDGVWYLQR